jgi:hypothetical protein
MLHVFGGKLTFLNRIETMLDPGSHSGGCYGFCLQGYNAVWPTERHLTTHRYIPDDRVFELLFSWFYEEVFVHRKQMHLYVLFLYYRQIEKEMSILSYFIKMLAICYR